jgi:uncharacterized protein YycO
MKSGTRFRIGVCALLAACAVFAEMSQAAAIETVADNGMEQAFSPECVQHRATVHSALTVEEQQLAMQREISAYQILAEEALTMRARAIQLREELRAKQARGEPFSGQDLLRINQGSTAMLDQRDALMKASLAHECWLDDPRPDNRKLASVQSAGIAMSLSAALLLYDNYLSAISLFRSDFALRRHLNRADRGFALREGELNRIALSFASPHNRYRVRRAIHWFDENGYGETGGEDGGYRYLVELIEQSPSRQMVRRADPVGFVGEMAGFFTTISFDTLMTLKDQGVFVPSLLFGNAIGLVESRRGKLDEQPAVLERVGERLRAGDVLLEKTPFRLTDAFIPGHWGHVAIWVGRADELRDLGIWEHPVVRKYHAQIEAGSGVVEALRSGVEMNSLSHFMNIDDFAILREAAISDRQRAQVIIQALRQVGKGYDFNFDVESTDTIVCSELVYHTYSHQAWPTARHLGRVTISPDNVALRSLPGDIMSVVLLYHDGEEIAEAPASFMAGLLKKAAVQSVASSAL